MDSPSDFAKTYQKLTDDELTQVASEGGFTEEAHRALEVELARRKISSETISELHKEQEQEKTASRAVRTFSLRGTGTCFFGRNYLSLEDEEKNIQVRTKWFALFGFPVFPIASYRITYSTRSKFKLWWGAKGDYVDRIPLQWSQVLATWSKALVTVLVLWLVLTWHWRHHL